MSYKEKLKVFEYVERRPETINPVQGVEFCDIKTDLSCNDDKM